MSPYDEKTMSLADAYTVAGQQSPKWVIESQRSRLFHHISQPRPDCRLCKRSAADIDGGLICMEFEPFTFKTLCTNHDKFVAAEFQQLTRIEK